MAQMPLSIKLSGIFHLCVLHAGLASFSKSIVMKAQDESAARN
jgi:hypothetical protein